MSIVYVAHPVTSYGTEHERRQADRIGELLPTAEIVNPATRYRDGLEWLLDWPSLIRTLSGLVVFADEDDTIGAGVLREIADALARILPVACLDGFATPRELASIEFAPTVLRNPRRVATLRYGTVVEDLAAFLDITSEVPA